MDVNRALRSAVTTGKVLLGGDQTMRSIADGSAKLVVVSSNHPETEALKDAASKKNVPVYEFPGRRTELGPACGKPFPVGVLCVLDPGASDVLGLKKEAA
ncbi:MAG: 50S ribosomal protein L30e [Euryarchaeota archaeon]|nr:50S ribosomal protein L30e [Euryarchaeota archaeon]